MLSSLDMHGAEPIAVYSFTVAGNQTSPTGNPIPYYRTTQKSLWTDGAQRYFAFKEYIVTAFLNSLTPEDRRTYDRPILTQGKPLTLPKGAIAYTDIIIHWAAKGTHGDPDNIAKAVNDALFNDDRNVYGSTKPGAAFGGGLLEIKVSVYSPETHAM